MWTASGRGDLQGDTPELPLVTSSGRPDLDLQFSLKEVMKTTDICLVSTFWSQKEGGRVVGREVLWVLVPALELTSCMWERGRGSEPACGCCILLCKWHWGPSCQCHMFVVKISFASFAF